MNLLELTAPFRKAIAASIASALVLVLARWVDVPSELGPTVETVAGGFLTALVVYVTSNRATPKPPGA